MINGKISKNSDRQLLPVPMEWIRCTQLRYWITIPTGGDPIGNASDRFEGYLQLLLRWLGRFCAWRSARKQSKKLRWKTCELLNTLETTFDHHGLVNNRWSISDLGTVDISWEPQVVLIMLVETQRNDSGSTTDQSMRHRADIQPVFALVVVTLTGLELVLTAQ